MTHHLQNALRPSSTAEPGGAMSNGSMIDAMRASTEVTSPFGRRASSWRGRAFGALGIGLVLTAAGIVAWLATRGKSDPKTDADHDHTTASSVSAERSVMLTADEERRIGVTYATAVIGPIASEIRTVAQVTYDETRMRAIAPKLDGWVEQLYVNYTGQPVRAGDPLLGIYSPMLVQAQQELLLAAQLQRDVGTASADVKAGAGDLREAARRRLLYWDISPSDIERIEQTGEVQKTVMLRSPVNGVVVEKNVLSGQKIMAGDALYSVADLHVVWIEGEVFERDLAAVHVGQRVKAEFQAIPGETRSGRITYIYPTISPDTRTARVRVEMTNANRALKPGMYATIRIEGTARANVLTVPRSAVLATGERNLVFVRRSDGMLEPRTVTIGGASDEHVEVLTGVRSGESVVASATFLVDAESNLGSLLGGMGNIPGMDIAAPAGLGGERSETRARTAPAAKADSSRRQ